MESTIGTEAVFIIGSPRSGTSILAWSLAKHEDLWTSAEADFLFHLFRKNHIYNVWKKEQEKEKRIVPWLVKNEVGFVEFSRYLGKGLDDMFLSRSGGLRWIDSAPSNTAVAEQNALCFPNAKFIHMLRDGTSVVNSMIRSGFSTSWAQEFGNACKSWVYYVDLADKFQKNYSERTMLMKFEELVADPEGEFGRLHDFLGVQPSSCSAEYMQTTRMNSSFNSQESRPKNAWDNWKHEQRNIFKLIAQETMERYSYPVPF